MKLSVSEKIAVGAASCVAVVLFIIAGSSARGGGGPGFGSQNNPGMQGSQFGQAAANGIGSQPITGGPGFGPGNNPGVDGSAYGRSIASDASSGRSDRHDSNSNEQLVDTDAGSGKGKAGSEAVHDTSTTSTTHVLSRISSETGVPIDTLHAQKSATGLGYGDLEIGNLLAKASGQSFDSLVAKFKAGEGWGKIAHDMGLNLGKIVSAAHRSSKATQENAENTGKPSLIPPPGIKKDSIVFTGITPIPSATVSRGVNPVPSATMESRP
jgi:hypothetical protein